MLQITQSDLQNLAKLEPQLTRLILLYAFDNGLEPISNAFNRSLEYELRYTPTTLVRCGNCYFYYNPSKNTDKSCLYHPGEYGGYGHSCSSFDCCGSNTPGYSGTPGCRFGPHTVLKRDAYRMDEDWLPEFFDVPYTDKVPLFYRRKRSVSAE